MPFKKYPILSASRFSVSFLAQPQIGTVHSVYRKTINLNLNGQLLALQAKESPLSPISLITALTAEEMDCLGITAGMSVRVQDCEIKIGRSLCFYLKCTFTPDLRLHSCGSGTEYTVPESDTCNVSSTAPESDLQESVLTALKPDFYKTDLAILESQCLKALCSRNAGSFELLFSDPEKAQEIPFLAVARQRLTDTLLHLEQKQWEKAAQVLVRLIGLGLGLTPGGDDFLCGVLAGLIFCGAKNSEPTEPSLSQTNDTSRPSRISNHPFALALETQIQDHLCDTNDISAAFLRCALDGQFSLAVNRLPALKSAAEILSVFSEIGHSSGTDSLCGVYFILKNRNLLHGYTSILK